MLKIIALAGVLTLLGVSFAGRRANGEGLSCTSGAYHRAAGGRLGCRSHGARRRAKTDRSLGPAIHRRQPAWRERHHRP